MEGRGKWGGERGKGDGRGGMGKGEMAEGRGEGRGEWRGGGGVQWVLKVEMPLRDVTHRGVTTPASPCLPESCTRQTSTSVEA